MSFEAKLWSWLRAGCDMARYYMQRIENRVGRGTPDGYMIQRTDGKVCWLELKFCRKPARPNTGLNVKIRESQFEWFEANINARAVVLLRVHDEKAKRNYHFAIRPRDVMHIRDHGNQPWAWWHEASVIRPGMRPAEILDRLMEFSL